MPQFIEAEIVIPALKAALVHLSHLSLSKLGIDITKLPFWLAIIGFPLAVFETCTKHIATALNLLLHKFHLNLREVAGLFFPILLIVVFITFFMFVGFENGKIQRQVTQAELTTFFYYSILIVSFVACFLFITSLSRLTGQGNYVTGIGFLVGAASIYIEVVQEYGVVGQISSFVAFITTIGLWIYGRNYNLKLEKQRLANKQPIYQTLRERSTRQKRLQNQRIEK